MGPYWASHGYGGEEETEKKKNIYNLQSEKRSPEGQQEGGGNRSQKKSAEKSGRVTA